MRDGGLILWNAVAICETFKTSLRDWKTPCERRFGRSFKGPIIPLGALVEYLLISTLDQARVHQFEKKVLSGFFFGCALIARVIWKGDILVADLEELETKIFCDESIRKKY